MKSTLTIKETDQPKNPYETKKQVEKNKEPSKLYVLPEAIFKHFEQCLWPIILHVAFDHNFIGGLSSIFLWDSTKILHVALFQDFEVRL